MQKVINTKEEEGFKYIETNPGQPVLFLLHGLFGAMSNFKSIVETFSGEFNVVVPILPIYELSTEETGLGGLLRYTKEFVEYKGFSDLHMLGNSLGGHIAQLFVLDCQDIVSSLVLTGSSGLFESGMGDGYPRRGDYEYIKRKTQETFYDPAVASKELVDEVYGIVNDRNKALRIILTAKSALKHNLADRLQEIHIPVLLVWGNQDTITPPFVGERFHELLKNSELVFIDKCGHAPMMESPDEFNIHLKRFLLERTV